MTAFQTAMDQPEEEFRRADEQQLRLEWERQFTAETGKFIWKDGTVHDESEPVPHPTMRVTLSSGLVDEVWFP